MFNAKMKCIECDKIGKPRLGDVEVQAINYFNISPGWYCVDCLIRLIKEASVEWIEE